ncbi:MAG: FAD:protein FMN transferase [Planctomycetota bacterium]
MNKKNVQIAIGIIAGVCLIAALYFWPEGRIEADSGHRLVMGTFARVVAVVADSSTAKKCIDAALVEIQKVDELMSDYKSDSEISEANRDAAERAVKVSKSTYEVLQRSVEFSKLTDGAFDVTVGPLVDLWRLAADANSVPTDTELRQARSKVGYEKLILDANEMSIRFAVGGMRIDLGGIAKGYAIDKAIEAMQNCGAAGGMVDIGGDIRCFGVRAGKKDSWLVGLQDPGKAVEAISGRALLLKLKLVSRAVATSGDYQQFILIEGKRHSHIIDRRTATGARGLSSVTIIADSATDADALATAVSVMGTEKGLALIEKTPEAEAILISSRPSYKLIKTSGAEKYIE